AAALRPPGPPPRRLPSPPPPPAGGARAHGRPPRAPDLPRPRRRPAGGARRRRPGADVAPGLQNAPDHVARHRAPGSRAHLPALRHVDPTTDPRRPPRPRARPTADRAPGLRHRQQPISGPTGCSLRQRCRSTSRSPKEHTMKKKITQNTQEGQITRRQMVVSALAAAGVITGAPTFLRALNLHNKLNIAMIAC